MALDSIRLLADQVDSCPYIVPKFMAEAIVESDAASVERCKHLPL